MRTSEGRLVGSLRVPPELFAAIEAEAVRRGVSVGRCAGDLVAEVLPEALAETARELLSRHAATPPGLPRGVTDNLTDTTPVAPKHSPGDLDHEDVHGAAG